MVHYCITVAIWYITVYGTYTLDNEIVYICSANFYKKQQSYGAYIHYIIQKNTLQITCVP